MSNEKIKIEQVNWQDKESHLRHIRTLVFIEEQQVPEELEWDKYDETAIHVLAYIDNDPVATGRLIKSGQIGRMAVLEPYRKQGVGRTILKKLLSIAETMSLNSVFLNSQVDAIEFYKRFNFVEEGAVFDDAGIPHKKMKMIIK